MDFIKKILGSKATGWVATLLSVLAMAYVLVAGGTTTETFTGKNGAEYEIKLTIPEGVLDLIEKCDLKTVGQTCPVSVAVDATLTKEATKTLPVTPEAKPVVEPKPAETPTAEEPAKPKVGIPIDIKKVTPPKEVKEVPFKIPTKPNETK